MYFILHAGDHWVTLTNINPHSNGTWLLYESLNNKSYVNQLLHTFRKLSPDQNTFYVETVNVARQKDFTDCGLYAIAYLVAIIHNRDPTKLLFNQNAMRKHFNLCLLSDCWDEFPNQYLENNSIYTLHELDLGNIPVNW